MNTLPGLIGKKLGFTQVFDASGNVARVTVVEAGPCVVVRKRTEEKDGYTAVQIGWGKAKVKNVSKPNKGHYAAAKAGVISLARTLALELGPLGIRINTVAPGAVETEFSLVRFDGDEHRADSVYAGITPLTAEDVAEVIGFVASRPAHVDLDQIVLRPRDQAPWGRFSRRAPQEK